MEDEDLDCSYHPGVIKEWDGYMLICVPCIFEARERIDQEKIKTIPSGNPFLNIM